MSLPYVEYKNANSDATTAFNGLCHRNYCADGQLYDTENMSADRYPFLSVRKPRGECAFSGIYAMEAVDKLCRGEIKRCFACVKLGEKPPETTGEESNINATSEPELHTCIFFYDDDGNEAAERICIDGDAENTTLISQAGYLYAFPQAVRINLMTDEPMEELGADVKIVNNTPSDVGGFSEDSYIELKVINCDKAFVRDSGVCVVTGKSTWDLYYKNQAQWFNAFLIKVTQQSDTAEGTVYTGVIEKNYYFEEKAKTGSLDILQNENYIALTASGSTADLLFDNGRSLGNKFVINLAEETANGYSPMTAPELEIILTPSDEEGKPITTGEKAESFFTRVSTTAGNRQMNELIIYKNMANTGTNIYGSESICGADGIVTEITGYGKGNSAIPAGGFVLSGIGATRAWIDNNISVGNYIAYDETAKTIKVYESAQSIVVTSKPDNPANGMRWYDDVSGGIYVYSSASGVWVASPCNYITLSISKHNVVTQEGLTVEPEVSMTVNGRETEHFAETLCEGDAVTINGFSEEYDSTYIIAKVLDNSLVLNGSIPKEISAVMPFGGTLKIERKIPKMDFVIECANRLWGCRYGLDEDGKVVNEIYASALGDAKNFYKYEGISTDAWTATVGVPGKFTGAVKYGDYPMFFKENAVIRVFGTSPSSYQTADYRYRGIMEGSYKSAVTVNEVLYYLSRDGVLAFSGGAPVKVDTALGETRFCDGVAGRMGGKLYISVKSGEDGRRHLYTLDTSNSIWYREDNLDIAQMLFEKGQLYYVLADGSVKSANGAGESAIEWSAQTGWYGYGDIYKKRLERVRIRAYLGAGTSMTVWCAYDNGQFVPVSTYDGGDGEILSISFLPQRCESFAIKFTGNGDCEIISVYRETKYGGDR